MNSALFPVIAHLVHDYGLVVVAVVLLVENFGVPVPGETALILAGIIAGTTHELSIVAVVLTAAGASIIGQMIGYVIGREFGYWLLLRYGGYVGITEGRIKLGEYLFLRHGTKIVFAGRFVPLLRSLAGILAGANRMPWRQFMLANAVGALVWTGVFGTAAYILGRQVEHVARPLVIAAGILTVIVIAAAALFVRRHEAQLLQEAERALPGPLKWQP